MMIAAMLAIAMALAMAQQSSSQVESGMATERSDTESEEMEWPQDIVETGKRTGLGAAGYVKKLRENCVEKKIQGACDVLDTNKIPYKSHAEL